MTSERYPEVRFDLEHACRTAGQNAFHLVTRITAPETDRRDENERPPLNLSFVVDRSGSMSGGTFDLARQGVEYALGMLNKRDSVSLVVYDNEVNTLLSQRSANREARAKATRRLRRVHPRGSTALAEGWGTGCSHLAAMADERPGSICRVILLTDGLANVGECNPQVLARDAAALAARGITTTTFGVGQHFDEVLLANMADAGRGRYHYIADNVGIPHVFAGELGEMIHITMRQARCSLSLPAGWTAHCLNDLPQSNGEIELGDVSSGDTRTLIWEINAPAALHGQNDAVGLTLSWDSPEGSESRSNRYDHEIKTRTTPGPVNSEIQDSIALVLSARAQAEALEYNRARNYEGARAAIRRAREAMPTSNEGMLQSADLERFAEEVAAPLSANVLKERHFTSRRVARTLRDYSKRE